MAGLCLALRPVACCAEPLQFRPQPVATENRLAVAASDLIRLAAQTARRACPLDHVLSAARLAFAAQVPVLEFYMSTCLVRVVPGAVSVKLTTGVLNIRKEMRDFRLNDGRGICRKHNRGDEQTQQRTEQHCVCCSIELHEEPCIHCITYGRPSQANRPAITPGTTSFFTCYRCPDGSAPLSFFGTDFL